MATPCDTFTLHGFAHEFRVCDQANTGAFIPAPPTVIVMADILPSVKASFPHRHTHQSCTSAASAASHRFERMNRDQLLTDLRVLAPVSTDCGFFVASVFDSLLQGSIWVSQGIPSAARLTSSFSVFTFLRMTTGLDNTTSLPPTGWSSLP